MPCVGRKHDRRALVLGLSALGLMLSGCGDGGEPSTDATRSGALNPVAGSVGACVEFEPYPGYTTCLLDAPQGASQLDGSEQARGPARDLPSRVNHREDIDARCPPVHDQGECGWCVAHATTAALEAIACRADSTIAAERVSEPHLWWLGRPDHDVANCRGGWYTNTALAAAAAHFLVPSSVWPYTDDAERMAETMPSAGDLSYFGRYSAADTHRIADGDVNAIKAAVAEEDANVLIGVPVFRTAGWLSFDGRTTGQIAEPDCDLDSRDCLLGYHAILIVGYDDRTDDGSFTFRNSWGNRWGDHGYGQLPYAFVRMYAHGIVYTTALDDPPEHDVRVEVCEREPRLATGNDDSSFFTCALLARCAGMRGFRMSDDRYGPGTFVTETYDNVGHHFLTEEDRDGDGVLDIRATYTYDARGLLDWEDISIIYRDYDEFRRRDYTYDEDGRISTMELKGVPNGVVDERSLYTHDDDGDLHRVTAATDYDGDGAVDGTSVLTYRTADGRMLTFTEWFLPDPSPWDQQRTYSYNGEGWLTTLEVDRGSGGGDGDVDSRAVFTHDGDGNILTESWEHLAEGESGSTVTTSYACWE